MRNIDELILRIRETVENHRLSRDGEYCRYLWQDEKNERKMGLNEYGCADAINLLYTLNDFQMSLESRKNHVEVLQSLQDPRTGLFTESTHHFIHTTAHCTAALELLDAKPLYAFHDLAPYKTSEGLVKLLDGLSWKDNPWGASHRGAGIYAAMKLNEEVDLEWEKTYFDWLWENADEEFGFWKKGTIGKGTAPLYHYIGSGFHFMFNYEYAKMPIRYPEKIIALCLDLYYKKEIGHDFGYDIGFITIDWVYAITRSLRQSGYRREDCIAAIREFADEYLDWLYSIDYKSHDKFNDLHMLIGTACALAEMQSALPGELQTKKPLRLVLDRRPFI